MAVVLLFPGQGSQKPGMGRDLAASHSAARQVFEAVDAALGEPLSSLCFEGPADTLTLTHEGFDLDSPLGRSAFEGMKPGWPGILKRIEATLD